MTVTNNVSAFTAAASGVTSDGTNMTFGSGNLLATSPKITTGINDTNGNSMLAFTATASAVDGFTLTNAATANPATVTMASTGSDSNINMTFTPKGGGNLFINPGGTGIINVSSAGNIGVLTRDVGYYGWASGSITAASVTADTALARDAAGGVQINNGTGGRWGYLKAGIYDSGTTTITTGVTVGHRSSGTPAAGLGSAVLFNIDSSTTADQNAARIAATWTTATHASRTADLVFYTVNNANALSEAGRFKGDGSFIAGGTTTNDNAASGKIGEYVSSLVAVGSPQSLSNGTAANVTSISLTAGDWDVTGQVNFTETTSTVTARSAGISSTSATLPTDGSEGYCGVQSTATSETNSITLCRKQISLNSTTTIYLVGKATFSAGTCGGFGAITARRVR